jgi:HK97 family phage portal protein
MAQSITSLFDGDYGKPTPAERRSALENPSVPLSAALASLGWGQVTDSNERVDERTALQVPTVLACVRILSEGVGSLPLRVYEELPRGRRLAKQHFLYRLLTLEPNPECTAISLLTTAMVHAVLWQDAYIEIERNAAGQCIGLWPRVPWRTRAIRRAGRLVYETTDTAAGTPRQIEPDDMLHIPGFSLDALTGTSLIGLSRQSVGLSLAAAKYGARLYANSSRPCFVLQLTSPFSPEDTTRLRTDLESMTAGVNSGRIAVMPYGTEAKPLVIEPINAQFAETRRFEREEIAAAFRVPGYMVGATEKALKSTIESQNLEFLTYSLRPWLERFEQEAQRKLLPSVGRNANRYSIHFYADAMLSVDVATRTARYTQGRNGGWYSVNDIRESEGLEPIAHGDTYLQPLNMVAAGTSSTDIETEDEDAVVDSEPDAAPAAQARTILKPLFTDAIGRIQHRSMRNSAAFQQCLTPVITALAAQLRAGSEAGEAEQKAISKYLSGAEQRSTKWSDDPAPDEFEKLLRSLVFAIESDRAEARARKVLNEQ